MVDVKRTICKFFEEGTCDKGGYCSFAHGAHEIGVPVVCEAVVKRSVCRFFLQGNCDKGSNCAFAHGVHEVGTLIPKIPGVDVPTIGHGGGSNPQPTSKRTICQFWLQGMCTKGDSCGFAHGYEQIGAPVPLQTPASGRATKTCVFWLKASCNKGEDCPFRHEENPEKLPMARPAIIMVPQNGQSMLDPFQQQFMDPGVNFAYQQQLQQAQQQLQQQTQGMQLPPQLSSSTAPVAEFDYAAAAAAYAAQQNAGFQLDGIERQPSIGQGDDPLDGAPVETMITTTTPIAPFDPPEENFGASTNGMQFADHLSDDAQDQPTENMVFPDLGVKRTLCKFFEAGTCTKDQNCGYAHGDEELGQPVPAAAERAMPPLVLRTRARSIPREPENVKRNLCKFFDQGNCEKGSNCTWAHGAHELGQPVQAAPAPRVQVQSYVPISKPIIVTPAPAANQEKRTICKFWEEGKCQRGASCTFLHGPEVSASAKRTICKFWQENRCDKGRTCTFAHGSHELSGRVIVPPAPVVVQPAVGVTSRNSTVCKFWLQGDCQRGTTCQFSHAAPGGRALAGAGAGQIALPPPRITSAQVQQKRTICSFWLQDKCDKGDNCTFAHGDAELGAPTTKRARLD